MPDRYVTTQDDPADLGTFGSRYVFAQLEQRELTLTTRVNWILSPATSLRVFMQPLLAAGDYHGFKELAAPGTFTFNQYGATPGFSLAQNADGNYDAAVAVPGAAPSVFSFDNPDYNLKSLRLNAVLRWEFKPGSTIYAVWTEQRKDEDFAGTFRVGRDLRRLAGAGADDIFLLKVTYWIGK